MSIRHDEGTLDASPREPDGQDHGRSHRDETREMTLGEETREFRGREAAFADPLGGTLDSAEMRRSVSGATALETRVGQRYGDRYQIRRLLGRGGMGAVYVAFDEILDQEVALKFLLMPGEEADVTALRGEVQLAQRVTHENVCRTYDLEQIDGELVIKMEYVAGQTLSERLRQRGPMPADEALGIARAITAALGVAHAQGVIHRDLKPDNILIEAGTGRVVLMDFGIADVLHRTGDAQGPAGMGTPAYMAPEQVRRLPLDGRADLYALGCTLYELLTGAPPFTGNSAVDIAMRQLSEAPQDPRRRCPALAPWIARILLRLLEKEPARRFASAQALQQALARPPDAIRRLLQLAAAALLLVLSGSLVYGITHKHAPGEPPWQPAIAIRLPEYDENADVPVLSPDGRLLAYASDRDGSFRLYVEPVAGGKARALTPPGQIVAHASWAADGRSLYAMMDHSRVVQVSLDGSRIETVAENAFRAVACGSRLVIEHLSTAECPQCAHLVARDLSGAQSTPAEERLLLKLEARTHIHDMRCDRAGRQLVYVIGKELTGSAVMGDLWLLPFDTGSPRQLLGDGHNSNPIFTADGKSVVFFTHRGDAFGMWELATAAGSGPARPLTLGELPNLPGDVSADGKQLYFTIDFTTVQLYATRRSGVRRKVPHPMADFRHILVAPSGTEVLAIVNHGEASDLIAYAVADGSERLIAKDANSFALTPGGREVVYAGNAGGRWHLAALPLAGGRPRHIADLEPHTVVLAVAPDGDVYLTALQGHQRALRVPLAGGTVTSDGLAGWAGVIPAPAGGWRIATNRRTAMEREYRIVGPGRPLDDPKAEVVQGATVTWAPDGRSFLIWNGNALHRYTVGTASSAALFPVQDMRGGIAISPDGETIYTAELLGRVHRRVITNFDERPRVGVSDATRP